MRGTAKDLEEIIDRMSEDMDRLMMNQSEIYCCTKCFYIDKIDSMEGFWEKGEDKRGVEIFKCNGCQKIVKVRPATLEDLKKGWIRK